MIQPTMAVVHFKSFKTGSNGQYLMTQTDSKNWFVRFQNFLYCVNSIIHHSRIARAVGEEVSIRVPFIHFSKASLGRKHLDVTSARSKTPQNVSLDSIVKSSNFYGG